MKDVRDRSENARRGLFARHNELVKLYMQLREEVECVKAIHQHKSKDKEKTKLVPFFTGYLENYQ